jgi:hypothetical protein
MKTKVCYHIQTHKAPAQVTQLIEIIKRGSPESVVVISHDDRGLGLDIPRLTSLPNVYVINGRGGYGDFSHLDRYFTAVDWLDERGIEYDWLENLTGQDFPLRPIPEIEDILESTEADGYLQYAPVFPERTPKDVDWGAGPEFRPCRPFDASMRYEFRHWRIGRPTPAKQRWLRPFMIIDWMQPWVRLSLAYQTIGVRRRKTIFNSGFIAYGGLFQCTLSARCVRYVRNFARENPDVVAFFRTLLGPEEVFLQTVLVNSGKFHLIPDAKRYVDFTNQRNARSKILDVNDLNAMVASGAHWARKFDQQREGEVLEILRSRIEKERP